LTKEIEKCDRNLRDFLAVGDMRNYCIEVHSIKSALFSIGAAELGQEARELELASKRDDDAFCAKYLPPLLEGIGNLRLRLEEIFLESDRNKLRTLSGLFATLSTLDMSSLTTAS